jgi:hypothetical protein
MFKASVFLYSAAADYSHDRHGRIQRSWTGNAMDFTVCRNRAVGRLRGLLIYFWLSFMMLLQYSISQPAIIRQQRMVGITHYSFGEYCVACCEDEGGRILPNLGVFFEASAAHRSLGGGWSE